MTVRLSLMTAGLVLLGAATLFAHDFWLVPNAFRLAPGAELVVDGRTSSSFPSSLSAVTVDRVAEARILSAHASTDIEDLSVHETSLRLRHRVSTAGQLVVAVRIYPRTIPESAESFRRYLALEGAPELLEQYEQEGLLPDDSITRRYAKYAKVLVEAGRGGPPAYARLASHPLEFKPMNDPTGILPGETLALQLLFEGELLGLAKVHAGVAASARDSAPSWDETFRTDSNGVVEIPVDRKGIWNVRALHIVPARPGSGADWDVHWATFVFSRDGDD